MALKPLELLRKGLKTLQNRVKTKKEALEAQLAKKKSISQEDEEWLDNEANLVDGFGPRNLRRRARFMSGSG